MSSLHPTRGSSGAWSATLCTAELLDLRPLLVIMWSQVKGQKGDLEISLIFDFLKGNCEFCIEMMICRFRKFEIFHLLNKNPPRKFPGKQISSTIPSQKRISNVNLIIDKRQHR